MSEPGMIYAYRQQTPFTTRGSGTARWCRAERDGQLYFVKEFLSPTLPPEDADMSLPVNQARRDACIRFFHRLRRLYAALQSVNNGCLICPDGDEQLFVHGGHYCAVAPFITPDVPPEAVCALDPREKTALARTLVLSLRAVHGAGIVHGDIKPDCLMVSRSAGSACDLRLIDFDSAFFAEEPPTSPEAMHGDLACQAPETLLFTEGEAVPLTAKLDVFALGLVLHRMWCGSYPAFPAEFRCAGEAVLAGAPVTLSPDLPAPLAGIIARMLAADPAARPDLTEVCAALNALPAGAGPEVPAETPAFPAFAPEAAEVSGGADSLRAAVTPAAGAPIAEAMYGMPLREDPRGEAFPDAPYAAPAAPSVETFAEAGYDGPPQELPYDEPPYDEPLPDVPYEASYPEPVPPEYVPPRRRDWSGLAIGIAAGVLIFSALLIALLILKG